MGRKNLRFSSLIISLCILFSFASANFTMVFAAEDTDENGLASSGYMSQAAENDNSQSEAPVSSSLSASSEVVQSEIPASSDIPTSSDIASLSTIEESSSLAKEEISNETPASSESKEEFVHAARESENALKKGFVPGEVLVVFNENIAKSKQKDIVNLHNSNELQTITSEGFGDIVVAEISKDKTVEEAIAEYEKNPNVAFAQPNYIYKSLGLEVAEVDINAQQAVKDVANDPEVSKQWHLNAINVQEAWRLVESQKAGTLVRVAVIDSTTQTMHEDFTNSGRGMASVNQSLSRQFISGVPEAHVESSADGHATHVSGTIAAQTNNGRGVAGVANAPNRDIVEVVSLNIFDANGEAKASSVVMAIEYAKSINAKIVNMSIGLEANEDVSDAVVENAINNATATGVFFVAAGGNNNTANTSFPSDFKNVCGVISTDENGQRASTSNYGAGKNVAAPGVGLLSTYQNSSYGLMSGTSAATPVVAGVAALMVYVNPLLTPAEICEILEKTASNSAKTEELAWGVINAAAAVQQAGDYRTIELNPANVNIFLSKQLQLNPIIKPNMGNGIIEWESSKPSIASVNANGVVTAKAFGNAIITATLTNASTATCAINVVSPVTSVRFAQKTVRLSLKKSFALSPVVYTSNGSSSKVVSWVSNRSGTVSVSKSGKITAKRVGKAVITAKTNNGKTAKVTVIVTKKAVRTKTIKVTGAPKKLAVGKSKYISGKIAPSNATGAKLTFKSSNKKIATIDAAGKLVAKKAGNVKITVSAGGKKTVVTVKITKK